MHTDDNHVDLDLRKASPAAWLLRASTRRLSTASAELGSDKSGESDIDRTEPATTSSLPTSQVNRAPRKAHNDRIRAAVTNMMV
jgi:hypothetical protein